MKQILIYILFASLCISAAAQTDSNEYTALVAQQKALRKSQDSLQSLLGAAREQLGEATEEQRTALSADIVRFEGEIFDMRSRVSSVDSEIAALEEKYAENTLVRPDRPSSHSAELHQTPFFTSNLSKKDIAVLAAQKTVESEVTAALASIEPLYEQLTELKTLYDKSIVQSEVDEIRTKAAEIREQIITIGDAAGKKWNEQYNYLIDTYLVMFDRAPAKDRATVEAIEVESRDVRRAETFMSSKSLIPQLSAFDLQRKLLITYQKAIAKAADLPEATNALASRKVTPVKTTFDDIEFLPRVLTIYGPVMFDFNYPSDNPSELPEMILPESGVYYSIQIALTSAPVKNLDMFKKVWPVQVERTADGKYRYTAGGFHTYATASKSLAALTKAGFKYPVILAWNNGKLTSVKTARTLESAAKENNASGYQIEITTKNPASAEIIKTVIDMHAKGKSISRVARGDEMHFTVTQFVVREEAEVLAQILRERTEASVIVAPIASTQQ